MSKVHVGIGEEFPLSDAPERAQHPCGHRHERYGHWHHGGHHDHHRYGPLLGLGAVVGAVALLTLAVTNPSVTLALLALGALAVMAARRFGARASRHAYRSGYAAGKAEAAGKAGAEPAPGAATPNPDAS